MYASAQRVRSPDGKVGVNSALYLHDLNEIEWTRDDVFKFVSTHAPGRLVWQRNELPPGGNTVVSYVDIVSPDPLDEAALSEILRALDASVAQQDRGRMEGTGWWAEYLTPDTGTRGQKEIAALWSALRLAETEADDVADPSLTIAVTTDQEGWEFKLTADSASRIPAHFPNHRPSRVTIPFEVASDFQAMHGDLLPHIARWATGLSREQLIQLGGVQLVRRGKLIWRLPALRSFTGKGHVHALSDDGRTSLCGKEALPTTTMTTSVPAEQLWPTCPDCTIALKS